MGKSLVFVLGIMFILLVSGCTQTGNVVDTGSPIGILDQNTCPDSCDDGDPCTADFCDVKTDFECMSVPGSGMKCGEDGICNRGICDEITDNCTAAFTDYDDLYSCYSKYYMRFAVRDIAPAWCYEIKNSEFRKMCYVNLAEEVGDANLCSDAPTQEEIDACYLNFADADAKKFDFNPDVCAMISDDGMKDECMDFEAYVNEVVKIDEFYIDQFDGKIVSYMIVTDRGGRSSSVGGTVEVLIQQYEVGEKNRNVELYKKSFDISKDDFEMGPVNPWGKSDIRFVFPELTFSDFDTNPSEKTARVVISFFTDEENRLYTYDTFTWK